MEASGSKKDGNSVASSSDSNVDIWRLRNTVEFIDSLAQSGFSDISAIAKLALARRFSAGSVAIYLLVVPMTRVLILMRHSETLSQVMKSLRHMASHTSEESKRLSSARKNSKMMLL